MAMIDQQAKDILSLFGTDSTEMADSPDFGDPTASPLMAAAATADSGTSPLMTLGGGNSDKIINMMLERSGQLRPDQNEVKAKRDAIMRAYGNLIQAQRYRKPAVADMGAVLAGGTYLAQNPALDANAAAFGKGEILRAQYAQNEADRQAAAEALQSKTGLDASAMNYGFTTEDLKNEMDLLKNAGLMSYRDQMVDAALARATGSRNTKPLPAFIAKMKKDAIDNIGAVSNINADLQAAMDKIDSGKLKFSVGENIENRARNFFNRSDEESRNYSTFKSSLERLRNESLRLNKGTQTEGDAQRAWNELFENLNDTNVVRQRLEEIKGYNARAADTQKFSIDSVLEDYGHDPLDVEEIRNPHSVLFPSSDDSPINNVATSPSGGLSPEQRKRLEELRSKHKSK